MVLIETAAFTKRVTRLLNDDEYRLIQALLVENPEAGVTISGSGGLRKLRWGAEGRGKRGGVRVVYYWISKRATVLLLFVFAKNEQDDLTADQLERLRSTVLAEIG